LAFAAEADWFRLLGIGYEEAAQYVLCGTIGGGKPRLILISRLIGACPRRNCATDRNG
jgi:hypothetical protein